MSLHISPYLLPYLTTADQLPAQLPDVPETVVQALQARIRKLVEFVAVRDETIRKLEMSEAILSGRLEQRGSVVNHGFGAHPIGMTCSICEPPRDEDR